MKLFISNQREFKEFFQNENSFLKKDSEIHKNAYSKLFNSVGDGFIPITIIISCEETDSDKPDRVALFEFKKVIDGIYFYEFQGVVE